MSLKRSRSMSITTTGAVVALGGRDRAARAVGEQHAVGQARSARRVSARRRLTSACAPARWTASSGSASSGTRASEELTARTASGARPRRMASVTVWRMSSLENSSRIREPDVSAMTVDTIPVFTTKKTPPARSAATTSIASNVAVARAAGEELEDEAARADREHVLAEVERPGDEALAVDAVRDRARDDLRQHRRADAAEQHQREHEGRRRHELALAAAELDGQDLADDDGDPEDQERKLEVA